MSRQVERELAELGLMPLALDVKRAAAYCGLSVRSFLALVEVGTYPQPMKGPGRRRWNRVALEAAHGLTRADADPIMGAIDEAKARSRVHGQGAGVSLFPARKKQGAAHRGAR